MSPDGKAGRLLRSAFFVTRDSRPGRRDHKDRLIRLLRQLAVVGLLQTTFSVTTTAGQAYDRLDPYDGEGILLQKELEIRASSHGRVGLTAPRAILTGPEFIYVLDPTVFGVHRFDHQGEWSGMIGREGDGPGEFRRPGAMGWLGDTLWVADHRLGRLSFFERSGEFVRSVQFGVVIGSTMLRPQRVLSGGRIVSVPSVPVRFNGDIDSLPVLLLDEERTIQDTLAWQAVGKAVVSVASQASDIRSGQRTMSVRHPFDRRGLIAFDPMGRWVYLATWRSNAHGDSYLELLQIAATGDTSTAAELPLGRVSLAPRDIETRVRRIHRTLPESFRTVVSARELTRIVRQQVSRPMETPTDAMVAGHDGTVWFRKTSEETAVPEQWAAYRPGEGFIGVVRLPTAHFLLGVTGETIWTVNWDELDLPTITRWRLQELK